LLGAALAGEDIEACADNDGDAKEGERGGDIAKDIVATGCGRDDLKLL
jgi:hypothetical protein